MPREQSVNIAFALIPVTEKWASFLSDAMKSQLE